MMNYYAGLDIGGTNGRLKISSENKTILGEFEAPGCSVNTDGYAKSRQRLRTLILESLNHLQLQPEDCRGICAAISGVDSPRDADACREIFEEMGFDKQYIRIANDCEVFLHLSEGPSLVVVSGTGSICYGRDRQNQVFRTGGWNHIVSDEGSGFDLGLRFLQAAANDLDGRAESPLLTSMIVKNSGLTTLEQMNDYINTNLFEKSQIAKYAQTGYEAACLGDAAAIRIHQSCAEALYHLIRDTYTKMSHSRQDKADLWLWGSILVKNELVRNYLIDQLHTELPALTVQIPQLSALEVALKVAES